MTDIQTALQYAKRIDYTEASEPLQKAIETIVRADRSNPFAEQRTYASAEFQRALGTITTSESFKSLQVQDAAAQKAAADKAEAQAFIDRAVAKYRAEGGV